MNNYKNKFLLTLTISREDRKASVYYKPDGLRFKIDHTIKMNVETTYKMTLNFRPPQIVKYASMLHVPLDVKEEEITTEFSSYSFLWTSNDVCVSKKNRRDHFLLAINLQGLDTLEILLQSKFYETDETDHVLWGATLHHIEYECVFRAESKSFEVGKGAFR